MSATLDIALLRTFHTVAHLKQFKSTAQQLHKSPAAISVQIQRLEQAVGGRLLDRDNQGVALTPLGRRLLANTRELLSVHDRTVNELKVAPAAGRIQLGVPDEYIVHVMQDILPAFIAAWPQVTLEISTAPSFTLLEAINEDRLDVAIIAHPSGRLPGGHLLQATSPVWVGAFERLEFYSQPIPVALYAAPCPYREAMIDALDGASLSWRPVLDTPSGAAVKACVESGIGVSVIDRARLTTGMSIVHELPTLPIHHICLLNIPRARMADRAAIELLTASIRQKFKL